MYKGSSKQTTKHGNTNTIGLIRKAISITNSRIINTQSNHNINVINHINHMKSSRASASAVTINSVNNSSNNNGISTSEANTNLNANQIAVTNDSTADNHLSNSQSQM